MKDHVYRNYLLGVLMLILAMNYVDRAALGLLLQDIKVDLALSDTQLGLLTGIAFAFFYAVMGIPIARWADRGNRVTIISITTLLWCGALALCGLAGSFLHLLLIRVGVAVGEAGCKPVAHSFIADHFSRAERPRAVGRYMLGGPLSVLIGYSLAGWLNELFGWRLTFAILGTPGLLLAALAWLTLREPRLQQRAEQHAPRVGPNRKVAGQTDAGAQPKLSEVFITLWANTTFRHLLLAFSVMALFNHGITKWLPAFFIRSHGLHTAELGIWFGVVHGIGGVIGTISGGELAARYAPRDEALQLRSVAVVYFGAGFIWALTYLSPNKYLAFGLMGVVAVTAAMVTGPMFATIQGLVPDRMRAMAIALIYLFANLFGMGLGPLAAGALSDALQPIFGADSLRYSLLALCPGFLWGAAHVWYASRTVGRDLQVAQANSDSALCGPRPVAASKTLVA